MFLHIVGDALASIAAITSGLLIEFVPWDNRYYFDPILSVFISILIMKSALPLSIIHPVISAKTVLMVISPFSMV